MVTTTSARHDLDSFDVTYREDGEGRISFDTSARQRYATESRHRRSRRTAASKNGVHRRRNKRNGL